jgi:hypothetical protein
MIIGGIHMAGLSTISYKGNQIIYVDYTPVGDSKEKTMQLMEAFKDEVIKYPLKGILALVNVKDLRFDKDILNLMKAHQDQVNPRLKKEAVLGMSPLHKAAYNFLLALTTKDLIKTFNTELEAKEWLVKD